MCVCVGVCVCVCTHPQPTVGAGLGGRWSMYQGPQTGPQFDLLHKWSSLDMAMGIGSYSSSPLPVSYARLGAVFVPHYVPIMATGKCPLLGAARIGVFSAELKSMIQSGPIRAHCQLDHCAASAGSYPTRKCTWPRAPERS